MPTIYISDSGDDKNDGLSLQTPIYSFKRAKELHGGFSALAADGVTDAIELREWALEGLSGHR